MIFPRKIFKRDRERLNFDLVVTEINVSVKCLMFIFVWALRSYQAFTNIC